MKKMLIILSTITLFSFILSCTHRTWKRKEYYCEQLGLYFSLDTLPGNNWRFYINSTPGADSDYIEFEYPIHDLPPGFSLAFPVDNPDVICVVEECPRPVKIIKSEHFKIIGLGMINNYAPQNYVDSVYITIPKREISWNAYLDGINYRDEKGNLDWNIKRID